MTNRPATTKIIQLFQQIESIRNDYADAEQKAIAEAEQLKLDIAGLESEVHETYRNYVLDIVTLGTYEDIKNKLESKQKMITIAEGKANSITQLMTEEITSVYQEIDALRKEFDKENRTNKYEQRKEIFRAKVEYLKAIYGAGKEIRKTDNIHHKIDSLKVELGVKRDYDYDFEDREVLALLRNDYTGEAGVDVLRSDIAEAFHSGSIDGKVLQKAK